MINERVKNTTFAGTYAIEKATREANAVITPTAFDTVSIATRMERLENDSVLTLRCHATKPTSASTRVMCNMDIDGTIRSPVTDAIAMIMM